jgi:hypothetical protein
VKTIAIDLDDTLNDFSRTLRETAFAYTETYRVPREKFEPYLEMVRDSRTELEDLLSTEYTFFRVTIHNECYRLAKARADGIEFMQWLRANGWRIVICTHRDLRRSNACTRQWLIENAIPFDYLFYTLNKLEFCQGWGIRYLIDDHLWNLTREGEYAVQVFHPIMPKHANIETRRGRGFSKFEEVKGWIQN